MDTTAINIDMVLQGIFIGVIIAVLAVGYNKLVLGKFVKALIKSEAVHPAFAKTFNELNVKRNIFLSFALRKNGTLRKIVYQIDNRINDISNVGGADNNSINTNSKNNDGNINNLYYYIPEDKLYRAGRVYGGKDVDILMLAAVIIIFFIFFAILLLYLPNLLNYASDVFDF
jgi:hypothetical protein